MTIWGERRWNRISIKSWHDDDLRMNFTFNSSKKESGLSMTNLALYAKVESHVVGRRLLLELENKHVVHGRGQGYCFINERGRWKFNNPHKDPLRYFKIHALLYVRTYTLTGQSNSHLRAENKPESIATSPWPLPSIFFPHKISYACKIKIFELLMNEEVNPSPRWLLQLLIEKSEVLEKLIIKCPDLMNQSNRVPTLCKKEDEKQKKNTYRIICWSICRGSWRCEVEKWVHCAWMLFDRAKVNDAVLSRCLRRVYKITGFLL